MEKEKTNLQVLTNGIIKENPTLVLVLGTCPDHCDHHYGDERNRYGLCSNFCTGWFQRCDFCAAKGDSRQGSYSVFYCHHCWLCYPAQLASAGVFPQHL